jgi:hypothetical protein
MSPQAGFVLQEEVVPRLKSSRQSFNPVGAEDPEELIADATCIAAGMLRSAERRGKKVTPGNVAHYAICTTRQGRRSGAYKKNDAMHPATQLSGRSRLVSLEEPLGGESDTEDMLCLHDTLAAPTEDPGMEAARRLDWQQFIQQLDHVAREILRAMASGTDLTKLVPKLRRSRSALQSDKVRLGKLIRECLGEDILRQVQQVPAWMDDIVAWRERSACRLERLAV